MFREIYKRERSIGTKTGNYGLSNGDYGRSNYDTNRGYEYKSTNYPSHKPTNEEMMRAYMSCR